jgi:glycosyltransferase involved in cell wall biosynthesis
VHIFEEPFALSSAQLIRIAKGISPKPKIVLQTFENIYNTHPFPYSFIEKRNFKNSDAIITVPKEGRAVWERKGFNKNIYDLPMGLDEKVFHKRTVKKTDKIRICYIGRIVNEKGIDTLIHVFNKLNTPYKNIELIIAGNGELKNLFISTNTNTNIKFTDPIKNENLPEFLSAMDILVLPSITTDIWKEQFGRVLIEAMACEAAVAGSSSGEIPNVIGDAGFVFPEKDENALYNILKKLIVDPDLLKEYSNRGLKRVKDNFTWNRVGEKLSDIYKEVTGSN